MACRASFSFLLGGWRRQKAGRNLFYRPLAFWIPTAGRPVGHAWESPGCCRRLHLGVTTCHPLVPFHLSDIGEGIKEVTIKEWFVKLGDKVNQFDHLCEVQSDKASVTITSRYDGAIRKIYFDADEVAQTGDVLVDIEIEGDNGADNVEVEEIQDTDAFSVEDKSSKAVGIRGEGRKTLATPAVRHLASQRHITLSDVVGTGKGGRVLKEDILEYIERRKKGDMEPMKSLPDPPAFKDAPPVRSFDVSANADTVKPVRGIVKAMMKSMSEALTIPHFGYYDEVQFDALVALRKELNRNISEDQIKLSYMPFMIKACSLALLRYPVLNSSLDVERETLTYKADHNVGLAMDTAQGLLVPNIKKVQSLSVREIALELQRLQQLGNVGKLGSADLNGGTFTLSNIGSIGGTYAKAVIMPPQVAIGAIGKIQVLPRFDRYDNVIKSQILNVSWSADHRVIDGATIARFSNLWKGYLENPASMILDLR